MKKLTRRMCLLLCTVLILTMIPAAAFAAAMNFTDVAPSAWYYSDVKYVVEKGFFSGRSASSFAPDANLTYAEAVKLAAALRVGHTGDMVVFSEGSPWYQTYVDYAKSKGIISHDYDWNKAATRAGYMEIFANALPADALPVINKIHDGYIPDVERTLPQYDAIYRLYRAGILEGTGSEHLCKPSAAIKRSEVAAIVARMSDPSKRLRFANTDEYHGSVSKFSAAASSSALDVIKGAPIHLSCTVSGGAAPYSYQWMWGPTEKDMADISTWNNQVIIDKDGNEAQIQTTMGRFPEMDFVPILDNPVQYIACRVIDGLGNQVFSNTLVIKFVAGKAAVNVPSSPALLANLVNESGNIVVGAEMTKPVGSKCSANGIRIYDAQGKLLKDHFSYGDYILNNTAAYTYQVSFAEAGIAPLPGTTYQYEIYTVVDGNEFTGARTTITAK